MRVFSVPDFGAPGSIVDRPVPTPGEGEILVRIRATSLNGMDPALTAGTYREYFEHRLPLTPGGDYAGSVAAVGPGVEEIAVGDEVFGELGKAHAGDGSFAQYATANAAFALPRPASLSPEEAAGLPRAGTTALEAVDALDLRAGDTLVLVGAAGGVASFVTQLAVRRGARVVAVTRGEHADYLRALGASEVIDYQTADVVEELRRRFPEGVAAVFDPFHDAQGLLPIASVLKPGGRIVSTVAMGGEQVLEGQPVVFKLVAAALGRTAELADLATRGELRVPVETLPFAEAGRALERQASRRTRGKLVLVVD